MDLSRILSGSLEDQPHAIHSHSPRTPEPYIFGLAPEFQFGYHYPGESASETGSDGPESSPPPATSFINDCVSTTDYGSSSPFHDIDPGPPSHAPSHTILGTVPPQQDHDTGTTSDQSPTPDNSFLDIDLEHFDPSTGSHSPPPPPSPNRNMPSIPVRTSLGLRTNHSNDTTSHIDLTHASSPNHPLDASPTRNRGQSQSLRSLTLKRKRRESGTSEPSRSGPSSSKKRRILASSHNSNPSDPGAASRLAQTHPEMQSAPSVEEVNLVDEEEGAPGNPLAETLSKQRAEQIASQSSHNKEDTAVRGKGMTKLNQLSCTVCLDLVTEVTATPCGKLFTRTLSEEAWEI